MKPSQAITALLAAILVMQFLSTWLEHRHHVDAMRVAHEQQLALIAALPKAIAEGKAEIERREHEMKAWIEREDAKARASLPFIPPR